MAKRSEDVLLQISEVRFKKGDGILYVMDQRIAWMLEHRDTVQVSHHFQDIKMQKISPEGKAKIQLQVVLHDGGSSTFHFINKKGTAAQLADRDRVKDLLQTLLPKFKRKVDRELEEKNKLLSTNPTLLQLYKDLVITKVVTSEEFWSQHAIEYTKSQSEAKQELGVNGAFLSEIKPQTDGCNGLKYNLTTEIIESIFKTYPSVHRKHIDNVPAKMTEAEFWTKFFQSHYFHRDRINTGSKDIFTECAKIDDQELKRDIQKGVSDPLLDVTSFDDKTFDDNEAQLISTGNVVHQSMLKRFNQHTIRVLQAGSLNNDKSIKSFPTKSSTGETNSKDNGTPTSEPDEDLPKVKRARIQEKVSYEDLEPQTNQLHKNTLHLEKVERYLHGPIAEQHTNGINLNDVETINNLLKNESLKWNQPKTHSIKNLITSSAALAAVNELSPGGALMRGYQGQSLAQSVPAEVEKELRNLYLALCELLKHFWACFPPTSPQLEQKASSMNEALNRFDMSRLKPFEERIIREVPPIYHSLTKHLNQLLNIAYRKFDMWQQRKAQLTHR